jgi:hypothetical protein
MQNLDESFLIEAYGKYFFSLIGLFSFLDGDF